MKKEKGITMIALIITIIILLILAGISIAFLTGENGIIKKAELAKNRTDEAQVEENVALADYEDKINEYIDSSRQTVSGIYPDYENVKEITFNNDKSYTVEEDGYIQINFGYTAQIDIVMNDYMYINNILIYKNANSSKWSNALSPLFLVKKGDLVTYKNTAQSVIGLFYNFR